MFGLCLGLFHDALVSRHLQILVTNTARRLVVIDVERGDQELCYDNCEFMLWKGDVYCSLTIGCVEGVICNIKLHILIFLNKICIRLL